VKNSFFQRGLPLHTPPQSANQAFSIRPYIPRIVARFTPLYRLTSIFDQGQFLLHNAMLVQYVLLSCVCPSVCPLFKSMWWQSLQGHEMRSTKHYLSCFRIHVCCINSDVSEFFGASETSLKFTARCYISVKYL